MKLHTQQLRNRKKWSSCRRLQDKKNKYLRFFRTKVFRIHQN